MDPQGMLRIDEEKLGNRTMLMASISTSCFVRFMMRLVVLRWSNNIDSNGEKYEAMDMSAVKKVDSGVHKQRILEKYWSTVGKLDLGQILGDIVNVNLVSV